MSFIQDTKSEIIANINKNINKLNCLSFLYGLFLTCGEISLSSKELEFFVSIDMLYDLINSSLAKLDLDCCEFEIEDSKNLKYKITVSQQASKILINKFLYEKNLDFNFELLKTENQKKDFLKAVFLTSGTGNIMLNSETNGYLLEFVVSNEMLALEISNLLSEFDIFAKIIDRKNVKVVYLNKFDQISDFFALTGATSSVLKLNNENAMRNVRSNINRQNNCLEANISKTINASLKQLDAINFIDSVIGINSLDSSLQEACLLRLANKEESLDNLVKLSNGKISKSGLNHRFNKIIKISEEIGRAHV